MQVTEGGMARSETAAGQRAFTRLSFQPFLKDKPALSSARDSQKEGQVRKGATSSVCGGGMTVNNNMSKSSYSKEKTACPERAGAPPLKEKGWTWLKVT